MTSSMSILSGPLRTGASSSRSTSCRDPRTKGGRAGGPLVLHAVQSDGPRAKPGEAGAPPAGTKAHGQTNAPEEEASPGWTTSRAGVGGGGGSPSAQPPFLLGLKSASGLINDIWAVCVLRETKRNLRCNDMMTKVPKQIARAPHYVGP